MRGCSSAAGIHVALCLLAFVSCISTTADAQESDPTVGRVIYIESGAPPGKLRVKQKRGKQPADASVGMPVRRGYLLILTPPAKAAIFCADGTRHELRPGAQGCPCTADAQGYIYEGSNIPRTRGYDSSRADFPAVISPRKGFLLTTRPVIRWSAPKTNENMTYEVSMYTESKDLVWRRERVTGTMLAYPADAPDLIRGEVYKVLVRAGRKSSDEEKGNEIGFTVLTETAAKSIREAEAVIHLLKLPNAQTQFMITDLYAAQGLFSEAIQMLTELTQMLKEISVLRLLADLYAASGLHREAVRQYKRALALDHIGSDIEGQALTLSALGRSYAALGENKIAASCFARAVEAYKNLGDEVTVEHLRDGRQK